MILDIYFVSSIAIANSRFYNLVIFLLTLCANYSIYPALKFDDPYG
jgi:hypothetical protein